MIPPLADVAQLVERLLAMQKVDGSSPFIRFSESPAQAGFFYAARGSSRASEPARSGLGQVSSAGCGLRCALQNIRHDGLLVSRIAAVTGERECGVAMTHHRAHRRDRLAVLR